MIRNLWVRAKLMIGLVLLMILLHLINQLMGGSLNHFGIIPRSEAHWFHIFTAPLIHSDWSHLVNNSIGLAIFSSFCLLRSVKLYILCSVFVITLTGMLVWFFARGAVHIGASGWIFGLWSFSIAIACFDRSLINLLSGFLVVVLYGGMIYGVLPSDPGVSFEAHLFGALSGAVFAFLYSLYLKITKNAQQEEGKINA